MNKKQIEKKLELRKITIANLDNQEMHLVQGGGGSPKCVSTIQSSCCEITDN